MDGKGCWRDNVFVERLWKSVKYEDNATINPARKYPVLHKLQADGGSRL